MVLKCISSCCSTQSPAAWFENSHITLNYFALHTLGGSPCAYHCSHLLRAIPSLPPLFLSIDTVHEEYMYSSRTGSHRFVHAFTQRIYLTESHYGESMSVGEIITVLIHTQSSKWPKICFPAAIKHQKQKRKALVLCSMASSNETAEL